MTEKGRETGKGKAGGGGKGSTGVVILYPPSHQVFFEVVLISPQARGLKEGRTDIKIKMQNLLSGYSWLWSRNEFLERRDCMQAMYQSYTEGEMTECTPVRE